jgi:hypothetical protein
MLLSLQLNTSLALSIKLQPWTSFSLWLPQTCLCLSPCEPTAPFPVSGVCLYCMYEAVIYCDIFVNCNWVDTRWQQYSTHLHTNSAQNNTKNMGKVRAVPCLCEFYSGICLTTDENARKGPSQVSRRLRVGAMKIEYTEQSIHNNKNP